MPQILRVGLYCNPLVCLFSLFVELFCKKFFSCCWRNCFRYLIYCESTSIHGYQFSLFREEILIRGFLNQWFSVYTSEGFSFSLESNFVGWPTQENRENWYTMNNITSQYCFRSMTSSVSPFFWFLSYLLPVYPMTLFDRKGKFLSPYSRQHLVYLSLL